ncbi:MAG: HNH endonuclease [Ardenticatenales bacterium]|nr:HNH endonuclease [Ardenticatenales bacterium]
MSSSTIPLRPGITNPSLWYPQRPPEAQWKRIRLAVMERDDWSCAACGHRAKKWMNTHHLEDSGDHRLENLVPLCVACHTVMHVGRSLMEKIVEVWQSEMSQVDIVRRTREGIKQGLSLAQIKKTLPLSPGPYPPESLQYANDLIRKIGTSPRAYLEEPLCAIFVNLTRWQLEE